MGDKAQNYGLSKSLLERMHYLYDKANLPINTCSVTLFSNYRCHSGVLMLPSNLFYKSTLQCSVPDYECHPEAPFPLVFVCSSLDEDIRNIKGVNHVEIDAVMDEVEYYFSKWPKHWGLEDHVCIMSPSANQVSEIKRRMKDTSEVEVLKAYDIQGTQFRAIVISTSEPTSQDGRCIYETKSICDRYVFNTAITRSRSLVVAIGNPFLLLELENQMMEKYGDDAVRCWSAYMRRCIECKTFRYSKKLQNNFNQSTSEKLLSMIYKSSTTSNSLAISRSTDTILKAYQKELERSKEYRNTKLLLSSSKGSLSWKVENKKHEHSTETANYTFIDEYECILEVINIRMAKGIPFDHSKQIVTIHGMDNRKPAFDGDTVLIGVFDNCRGTDSSGKVLQILKISNRKFVCRVSNNPIVFYPIDKKNPVLVNLPPLSRDFLKSKDNDNKFDLKLEDVVVFEVPPQIQVDAIHHEDTQEVSLPKIKHIIPLSVAKNMLFVVACVKWGHKYRTPLGIVEAVFPKGFTQFNAERILKFQHCVEYNDDEIQTNFAVDQHQDSGVFSTAFTIDPEGAQNLDDALSITKHVTHSDSKMTYTLAVHIVNAARHIEIGSDTDIAAKASGISVYGGSKGKVMHMLSSCGLRSDISLTPGQVREVISVEGIVDFDPTQPHRFNILSVTIKPTQIKSSIQLTYKSAQKVLEGHIPEKHSEVARLFSDISLCDSMKLLYDIALAMRLRRMRSDAAYAYDVSDPGEEECWQTHLLVEELMIWANNEVAKVVHDCYPNEALLRRQSPPNADKLQELIQDNMDVILNSLSLSKYIASEVEIGPASILIPNDVLQELITSLQNRDLKMLAYYLTTNKLYPQLSAVETELQSISLRAEYCCTEKDNYEYHHDALNLDKYTHFTSPMRRYFDIQVQRMLLESLQSPKEAFSHDEHRKLCIHLNTKMQNSRSFEKQVSQVSLSFEYLSSSKVYSAFVVNDKNKCIELQFPDLKLKNFPKNALKLKVSNISLSFCMASFQRSNIANDTSIYLVDSNSNSSATTNGQVKTIYVAENTTGEGEEENSALTFSEYNFCFKTSGSEIPATLWKELLTIIKSPSPSITLKYKERLIQKFTTPLTHEVTMDNKKMTKNCLYMEYKLKDPWKSPNLFKVWLSWSMRNHLISPIIQMVEFSSHIRFCVQHCSHPAECYSDPNLSNASKKVYKSIVEYINLWKKVLLAEAAQKSVLEKSCKPSVFRDVTLEWPKLTIPMACFNEVYYIPEDTVQVIIPSHFADCSEFLQIKVGDFVCLRCESTEVRAVFHFVVHKIDDSKDSEEDKEYYSVHLRHIGDMNCRISEKMKQLIEAKKWHYEMQIIPMSISFRKIFTGLLCLSNHKLSSTLSRKVAVDIQQALIGKTNYPVMRFEDSELVKSISLWSKNPSQKLKVLNEGQKEAMKRAINKTFQLIQGPPGTGKSETGARIAYVFSKLNQSLKDERKCLFYCGPSNKSVDVVLEKFFELLTRNSHLKLNILRIYNSSIEKQSYPDPSHSPITSTTAECPKWAEKFALHHMLRNEENCKKHSELGKLREIEEKIKKLDGKSLAPGFLIKQHKEAIKNATKAFLKANQFDIVFCTCNEASGQRAKLFSVRQCIIDESGMAYEPETIVPLRLCEHAVLIGDHKQLQPVIDYGPAKKCGLTTSLFERYAVHYEDEYTYTLQTQYRMHEEICSFPSRHFYDDRLLTDISVKERNNPETRIEGFWPEGPKMPIVFVDLVSEEDPYKRRSEDDSFKVGVESKSNTMEAQKVVNIAQVLHRRHNVPLKELAVLTPYSAQKEVIKKIIHQRNQLQGLLVASISESQGNEFGIVILSTVRSQPLAKIRNKHIIQPDSMWLRENLGFITDKHQINVGITRSKYGLIILGNQMLLRYNDTWEELLDHYQKKKCIVDGSFFPQE